MKLDTRYVKQAFTINLNESEYKETTIDGKIRAVRKFFDYLDSLNKKIDFRDITREQIKEFLFFIEDDVSQRTGKPYSKRFKAIIFSSVKMLFKFLYTQEMILVNSMQNITYKPKGEEKQKEIMSQAEMNKFLESITEDKYLGLRDRTIFELMYSSGLRISDVAGLKIKDIDFEERMLLIREGKWGKDRVVPVSKVAMKFLRLYLFTRMEDKEAFVFLGEKGNISRAMINRRFKKLLEREGMYREGLTAHSVRYSTATHLLSNGADLRFVQDLLGHESIETTCLYTTDLQDNIKRIYKTYHPKENEYYKEVDGDYLVRLEKFLEKLTSKIRLRNMRCRIKKKLLTKKDKMV